MAFIYAAHLFGGTPQPRKFLMTDNETAVRGRVYKFSSQRLTAVTSADSTIAFVALQDANAGTDVEVEGLLVTPTMLFWADYQGTPDAAFVKGQATADINTTGDKLQADDVTGGPCFIHEVDTTNKRALVSFLKTFAE